MSLIEAIANVVAGYGIAVIAQIVAFPLFGLVVSFADNLLIGVIFTVVSLARSYALRRLFESFAGRPALGHTPVHGKTSAPHGSEPGPVRHRRAAATARTRSRARQG